MFDTKLLITVTYLIVAIIVHHGYAAKPEHQQRCENLMQGFWFEYESDGKTNFQIAFYNLTTKFLNTYFEQRYEAIVPMNPRRGVVLQAQEKLLRDYISNLYSNHGLNLNNTMVLMGQWCTDKAEEVVKRSGLKTSMSDCKKALRKTFEFDFYEPKQKIYQTFYEGFTLNGLRIPKNKGGKSKSKTPSTSIDIDNTEELINNYPYFFFRYYEETIRVLGSFLNIEQYCSGLSRETKDQLINLPSDYNIKVL